MKKYFVKKVGKFLNTVLEFDSKVYPAEKKAEEWVALIRLIGTGIRNTFQKETMKQMRITND